MKSKKSTNKEKKQNQNYKYRDQTGGFQREGGRRMDKMGEGEREIQLPVIERVSHENKGCSTGNTVNGTVLVLCGDR